MRWRLTSTYRPRGLASCLRCRDVVHVLDAGPRNLGTPRMVGPSYKTRVKWAVLIGDAWSRCQRFGDPRKVHPVNCLAWDFLAPVTTAKPRAVRGKFRLAKSEGV